MSYEACKTCTKKKLICSFLTFSGEEYNYYNQEVIISKLSNIMEHVLKVNILNLKPKMRTI